MIINRRSTWACLGSILLIMAGCGHRFETGYHDFNKVQLQFYAPTGATVTVGQSCGGAISPDRSHQVNHYPDPSYRLEHEPEETATFNLSPGTYEFKYTGAAGWPGASVYGNIEIKPVCELAHPGVKTLLRKTFIPIALPAPGIVEQLSPEDDIYPYQSSGRRAEISRTDIARIQAGDMVTKVIFAADLNTARHEVDELEVAHACLLGHQQRLRNLLNEAQLDALENPKSKKFIALRCELKKIEQKIDRNRDRFNRLQALLRADTVLLRREMMVLATDEILPANEDPVVAARKLGTVVVVMRIGGRHLHWGNPSQEAAVFNK